MAVELPAPEWRLEDLVSEAREIEVHRRASNRIVGVNDECPLLGLPRRKPSDDLHPAVLPAAVAVDLAAGIVIEEDQVEATSLQQLDALVGGLDGRNVRCCSLDLLAEARGPEGIVIEEENLHHLLSHPASSSLPA